MSKKSADLSTETAGIGRRRFINTAALAGLPHPPLRLQHRPPLHPPPAMAAPTYT